jgi:hypothetical protein
LMGLPGLPGLIALRLPILMGLRGLPLFLALRLPSLIGFSLRAGGCFAIEQAGFGGQKGPFWRGKKGRFGGAKRAVLEGSTLKFIIKG